MNIVIIEDEQLTAEDLKDIILGILPEGNIIAILNSVEDAVQYFKTSREIDLIFSDIQLGDGLSFEIFNKMPPTAPIIFCTAYDEYALSAFNTNGIHYVLKPFNEGVIAEALEKFQNLKSTFQSEDTVYNKVIDLLQQKKATKGNSLLVEKRDRIVPLKLKNIAVFYIENGITRLITFDKNSFHTDKPLNEIEQICDDSFYRANRQFIIHRDAIKEIEETISRKVSVHLNIPFSDEILVSKEKKNEFLSWLEGSN